MTQYFTGHSFCTLLKDVEKMAYFYYSRTDETMRKIDMCSIPHAYR